MYEAYIALGSNIEPRLDYLNQATEKLIENDVFIENKSSIYVTKPVGYMDQDDFLNQVIFVKTMLRPIELLAVCQQIELDLGRKRNIRFGPRTIDLDILLFNNEIIDTDILTIPHPRMFERAFVLIPLKDVYTKKTLYDNRTIDEWLARLPEQDIHDVNKWYN